MTEARAKEARLAAFLDPAGPEVFRSVAYTQEIWKEDPLDVETIHARAREVFSRLIHRAGTDPESVGRVLLILGPAGCGKTHLMRAFRNELHGAGRGWFGYMQMTTETSAYERYLLVGTIDALGQPYDRRRGPDSGLRRLSDALVGLAPAALAPTLERLAEEEDPSAAPALAFEAADRLLVAAPALETVDPDLLRALLLLQAASPLTRTAVLKFLRGERLAEPDRARIGGLGDRGDPEDAMRFLQGLGHVMAATEKGAFVLCVDQLEDLYEEGDIAAQRFRRAMETIVRFSQQVPNAVVVVSCLRDYFDALERSLKAATRDRLVQDPAPIRLDGPLSEEEVRSVISTRLRHLFEEIEAPYDPSSPLDPFAEEDVASLAGLMVRSVLALCHAAQDRSMTTGAPPRLATGPAPPPVPDRDESEAVARLERAWNDFRAAEPLDLPEAEEARAALLASGLERVSRELAQGLAFVARAEGNVVRFECQRDGTARERGLIALCEKSPRGGGLYREVTRTLNLAAEEDRVPVIARSTEFPTAVRSRATQRLGEVVAEGGRRAVFPYDAWRDLALLSRFEARHDGAPALDRWLRWERPLSRLPAIQEALDLEGRAAELSKGARPAAPPAPGAPPPPSPAPPSPGPVARRDAAVSPAVEPFAFARERLPSPIGIAGGHGSGTTTLAAGLLERLLLDGVPALVLDRTGEYAAYAAPPAALRERLDVRLFTPGAPEGRPLVLPVVPQGLAAMPRIERARAAQSAAATVGGLLGYRLDGKGRDATRLAILAQAMVVAAEAVPDRAPRLDDLIDLIDAEDPALLHAIGKLAPRHCRQLVEHLETLRLGAGWLLSERGERPDLGAWFGARAPGDRIPLTVVALGPLGTNDRVLFWTARLFSELGAFGRQRPSDALQGVVLVEDADLFLPARDTPATKLAVEGAQDRLRSAGIGLILVTANPGDLDERARDAVPTWFVGRLTDAAAIRKLRPLFRGATAGLENRLAALTPGSFLALADGPPTPVRAPRPSGPPRRRADAEILAAAAATRPR